jgi:hypothetical protein
MLRDLCRIFCTTNFDRTMEYAAAECLGGAGRLVVPAPRACLEPVFNTFETGRR